ncbi:phosphatase PAP2 family protein [Alloalcanivorax gelatiniphagus]
MSSGTDERSRSADLAPGTVAPRDDSTSRHGPIAQLLISWSPLSAILLAYAVAGWISAPLAEGDGSATNRVGAPLHVLGPAIADERVFGVVPSAWLQQRFLDPAPQWYDGVAAAVYITHFIAIPVLTAVAWFRLRERFSAWLVAVLTMSVVGIVGYVAYPAAPPWLASERGDIDGVARVSHTGWDYLGLEAVGRLTSMGQDGSNPVAAMPSLHAGAAMLVALFLWASVGALARVALAAYAGAMGLTLVYTGEHYVVDIAAGWLVAVVGILAASAWEARRSRSPVLAGDSG